MGHGTIDEAIADPACRVWVNVFWDEASRHLPFPPGVLADYRAALLHRFSNPHMRDQLARIAADGSTKLVVRTIPTVRAERARGPDPCGLCNHTCGLGAAPAGCRCPSQGPRCHISPAAANSGELPTAVPVVLDTLEPDVGQDEDFVRAVLAQAEALTTRFVHGR